MERQHVSTGSIAIEASSADVWDALVNPAIARAYFFGATVRSDWKEGSPITFTGEFNGNSYHEKGTILQCRPETLLQYSHWSDLEQLPDVPENYRNWTFRIEPKNAGVVLSVTEDNIPDEGKRARSDEFWSGVLSTIKGIVESRTRDLASQTSS
jgi:uncharacterized protein YndB with AHSA1/START domain